jgi:DNA-directed RNA polymerase subunit RPC12/RpoP
MNQLEAKFSNRKTRMKSKIKLKQNVALAHSDKLKYLDGLQTKVLPNKQEQLKQRPSDVILRQEILDIINRKEEIEYMLDTSDIIMKLEELELANLDPIEYDSKKQELSGEYFHNTHIHNPDAIIDASFLCTGCSADLRTDHSENNACPNCGLVSERIVISDTVGFNERKDITFKTAVHYKRINYFTEWLNQIQAKEATEIPEDLKKVLLEELAKENITDMRKLNITSMRRFLKKCGHSKYYEHSPLIITELNGLPPLQIPFQVENMLKFMFKEIQAPWEELKSPDRNNFFSYPYILYKFAQLIDIPELLPYFPLLKSREKLRVHDILWKKIMEFLQSREPDINRPYEIDWKFIPIV